MKKIVSGIAAMTLAAALTAGAPTPAKADGGAVLLGVGAFLLVDALVGRHCGQNDWPFNIARTVDHRIHGQDGCGRRPQRRYR